MVEEYRDTSHVGASFTDAAVSGWDPVINSADSDTNDELQTITARARDLDRNNPLAQNIRVVKGDNIIGCGLQLSPMPNWQVLGWEPEYAAEWVKNTKPHWLDFCESRLFDADGVDNFDQATRLMFNSAFLGGSAVAIPMYKDRAGSAYKTCIKVVESDRLSNPNESPDTTKIAGGIERDKSGEVIAGHIRNTHPGDHTQTQITTWERIPTYHKWGRPRLIHVFSKERPGQSRGKPAATAVLAAFGLQGKYQLTELQAAVVNSKIAGILETPLSDEQAAELMGSDVSKEDFRAWRRKWKGELNAATILNLPPGTEFKSHNPGRPATAYAAYMEQIAREINVGFHLPFELGSRNFSKTNYSSAMAAMLEAHRHFSIERKRFGFQWATPVYSLFLEEAIDMGRIEGPDFQENRSAYTRAQWISEGQLAIDRLKDEKANTEALANGNMTRRRMHDKNGRDWREEREQEFIEAAEDKYFEEKYNVKLPVAGLPIEEEEEEDDEEEPPPTPSDTPDTDE